MGHWLLSGHNSRETFTICYPIDGSYFRTHATGPQMGEILSFLLGDAGRLDLSMPLLLTVEGRMYLNMTYLARNASLVFPLDPTSLGLPKELRGLVTPHGKPRLTTLLPVPFRFLRFYRRTMAAYRQAIPRHRAKMGGIYWQLRACRDGQLAEEDLVQTAPLFERATLEDMAILMRVVMLMGLLSIAAIDLMNRKAPALLSLLVGRGTSTALLGERMWELGQVAAQCGAETADLLRRGEVDLAKYRAISEAAPFLAALDRFLRTYGHRAFHDASEMDAVRLADQPELVLLTVGGLLEESEPPAVRAEAARQVSQRALREMNPLRRFLWRLLLKWGSGFVERREEGRDVFELQHAAYGLAARVLSRHHFPGHPDDTLFFYGFAEYLAFGQSRGQRRVDPEEIEQRRAKMEEQRRQPGPPELIWYDPETEAWWPVDETPKQVVRAFEGRLGGIAASAGSGPVEGVALVTGSAEEAARRLLETSGPVVLVTHVTDPVWSSIFRRLTAVVTEMGGVMSHAATVARENGIPAVVGVSDATRWIRDGQRVRVDGATGLVEVLD